MSICISKANAPLAFEVIQIHVSGESRGRLWLTSSNLLQNFQIFNWFYSILHYSTLYRPLFACLVFAFFENHQDAMTWCISSSPERRRQMSRVHRPTQLSIKGKQQSTTLVAHVFATTPEMDWIVNNAWESVWLLLLKKTWRKFTRRTICFLYESSS